MKITAWIGAGFMLLSAALYVNVTWFVVHTFNPRMPAMDFSFVVPMPFAIIAVPLMLIGGLFGKPKYYWLVSFFSGIFYIVVLSPIIRMDISNLRQTEPFYRDFFNLYRDAVYCILPGLFLMIEGIILFIKRKE